MLLLHILWDDWPIFMIPDLNEQRQQQLENTLLKPDCHSWWISKMQSGHENTSEEWYAIKYVLNLEKMPQKRMECFRQLFDHLAWIEHQFLSGIRDSRKPGGLWEMIRGVGGVRKSIHQSWLAKGLGLLCWGFKGVYLWHTYICHIAYNIYTKHVYILYSIYICVCVYVCVHVHTYYHQHAENENVVTANMEVATECIPTKPRPKCKVLR